MAADLSQGVRVMSGRRSRVVLTSRRWRQLGDEVRALRRGWWQQSPITRESTE